jgi:hypothetical protein
MIFDRHIVALDSIGFAQALAECAETAHHQVRRFGAEEPDHWHRRLLRACRKRSYHRRAAQKRDELAALQLIELHPVTARLRPIAG